RRHHTPTSVVQPTKDTAALLARGARQGRASAALFGAHEFCAPGTAGGLVRADACRRQPALAAVAASLGAGAPRVPALAVAAARGRVGGPAPVQLRAVPQRPGRTGQRPAPLRA